MLGFKVFVFFNLYLTTWTAIQIVMDKEGDMPSSKKLIGFRSKKAAQVSAFFASQAGGTIEKLKLIKLIYLAERLFIEKYGQPMLFDEFYSLKHGPICSSTLDGINGNLKEDEWSLYLDRSGNKISNAVTTDRNDLDEISDAEMDVLGSIWESFGFMTPSQIRNYTHRNCPEYREVNDGRLPISYKEVFEALNFDQADILADEINEIRRIDALLSA